MKNSIEPKEGGKGVLSIFCVDSLAIKARVTFDENMVQGVHVTYWFEDPEDVTLRINNAFDILFDELMKNRKEKGITL